MGDIEKDWEQRCTDIGQNTCCGTLGQAKDNGL